MGYNTRHTLNVDHPNERDIIKQFREEYDSAKYSLNESGGCTDGMKWYNSEQELREFSKKFPNVLFTLEGEGEEAEDLWIVYAMGGKSQKVKAKITYEPFDKSKLK